MTVSFLSVSIVFLLILHCIFLLPIIHFSIGVLTIPSTDDKSKAQVYEGQFEEGKMTGIGTLRYGLQTNKQTNKQTLRYGLQTNRQTK